VSASTLHAKLVGIQSDLQILLCHIEENFSTGSPLVLPAGNGSKFGGRWVKTHWVVSRLVREVHGDPEAKREMAISICLLISEEYNLII
jgi:hypothetical protein